MRRKQLFTVSYKLIVLEVQTTDTTNYKPVRLLHLRKL